MSSVHGKPAGRFSRGLPAILLILLLSPGMSGQEVDRRDLDVEPVARPNRSGPVTWAVLIGVDAYRHVRPLKFCTRDAEVLAETLVHRAGLTETRILKLTVNAGAKLQPTRENILLRLPEFLQLAQPGDSVIVFFSGHGFRDATGSTFLASIDCNRENLGLTAVPVATVRQYLESCKASVKLFLIDACHAGAVKGTETGLTAKDLQPVLENAVGVYTLASCQAAARSFSSCSVSTGR